MTRSPSPVDGARTAGRSRAGSRRAARPAGRWALPIIVVAALVLSAMAPVAVALGATVLLAVVVVAGRWLTGRRGVLVVLLLVMMWVPAGRYSVIGVPALLPWRVVALLGVAILVLSLCLDPRTRWRRSPLGWLVPLVPLASLVGVLANLWDLAQAGVLAGAVLAVAQLVLLSGFFLVVRQCISSAWDADLVLRVLVLAALVVAVSVGYERLTGFNLFINLQAFSPLQLLRDAPVVDRAGTARALGSANHPIALAVMLVMLLPIAAFLAAHSPWPRNVGLRRTLFAVAGVGLIMASVFTGSRTFVIMLVVMLAVVAVLDRRVLRPVAVVGVPASLVAGLLAPQAVLSIVGTFFDPAALIESQYASAGWRGSGRLADLGPSLEQAKLALWFGTGPGSRIVSGPDTNALILDNQYLSTLLETGLVGLGALLTLLVVPAVVLANVAVDRRLTAGEAHLALALACTFSSYAVSAFFFDALAFQQTYMLFFVLLGVASWLLSSVQGRPEVHRLPSMLGSKSALPIISYHP